MSKVYVGMSGGVDSSVAATLLKDAGHDVTGVYMKNWTTDLPGMQCPWAEDLADAKRVAVQLDTPFKVFDFQAEYKQKVVDYMIAEYKAGRTPNPDIMCNQEVKFKLFLDAAMEDGADMIATGHYARVTHRGLAQKIERSFAPDPLRSQTTRSTLPREEGKSGANDILSSARLYAGADANKDQSYFLYRVTAKALEKTLMPIGEYEKSRIREIAARRNLATAEKKDSQGVCFIGKVGMKEFLGQYVQTEPGEVVERGTDKVLGQHDGAIFYTIGQRQGLGIGGGLPYYVTGKDMKRNIVYVTKKLDDEALWQSKLQLASLHWIHEPPRVGESYSVRTRYRARLLPATAIHVQDDVLTLVLAQPERAVTPGQSTVFYKNDEVVGGGIVA